MKIAINFRQDERRKQPVMTYANSFVEAFRDLGHEVLPFGEGHIKPTVDRDVRKCDLILEIECGRNIKGEYGYQVPTAHELSAPTAVYFIDSHGLPDLHQSLAPKYNHVFFAVWSKRDLFINHPSSTWLPNATDLKYFGREEPGLKHLYPRFQFGFHGSKSGLGRATHMKDICVRNNWTYDIREVVKPFRHRWPSTGIAMRECSYIYNWGQKVDGPNLRVMETMAVGRPLITDKDPEQRDGMNKLFKEGEHLVYYNRFSFEDLEEKMKWLMNNPSEAAVIANNAYNLVKRNHLIINRAQTIIETVTK